MTDTQEKVTKCRELYDELSTVFEKLKDLANTGQFRSDNKEWQSLHKRQMEILQEVGETIDAI